MPQSNAAQKLEQAGAYSPRVHEKPAPNHQTVYMLARPDCEKFATIDITTPVPAGYEPEQVVSVCQVEAVSLARVLKATLPDATLKALRWELNR